jgi:DNA-binding NtrC family response regulator
MIPLNLKVLVAVDDELFREFIKQSLMKYSYDVVLCSNGQEAIDLLIQQTFDVILLDYKMPERSGLNLLQWMYEQKNNTPVILLTGDGSEHIAVEAMKLGVYTYLQKETADMERGDSIYGTN